MPSPSKNKGSGFEREVAKYLSGQCGATFIRAPGSGAYTGGSNSHRRQVLHEGQIRSFKGDIMPPEDFALLNAEAKFYADFPFHQLYGNCLQLETWLDQLMTASDLGDLNVLFMKFNRKGRYVAVQTNLPWELNCNYLCYKSSKYGDWLVYQLETFFTINLSKFKTFSNPKSKPILLENTSLYPSGTKPNLS